MSEMFLAVVMLTAPVGTPETVHVSDFPALRDAIHKTAIDWEILDPRETRYLLAAHEDFESDLNLLRKRYRDLEDAPKLADCNKLPDRKTVNALIAFNREFKKNLEERIPWELDRADILNIVIKENEVCYRHWDAMRDAQCDFYYVTVRRAALKKLRDGCHGAGGIGVEDFTIGKMPPHVPHWRFATR